MPTSAEPYVRLLRGACCLFGLSACESLLGLDEFTIQHRSDEIAGRSCASHAECASASEPYRCLQNRCTALHGDGCRVVAGPDSDDRAIWLGTVLPATGSQAGINRARQQSAILAVESINSAGGIPFDAARSDTHPLVLVACEAQDTLQAATRLTRELGIRAVIGPDDTQDASALATKVAIPNDTLLLNPLASATGFADLLDDDLSWSSTPSDEQRAPLMLHQLRALEAAGRASGDRGELKLGIVFRDDAQGQSARASLNSLSFAGKPLTDADNLGNRVRIDGYPAEPQELAALVETYAQFAPDIVILLGASEVVTQLIAPLERRWSELHATAPRPSYLLTDRAKVVELAELAQASPGLAARVRGVGVTPVSGDAFAAFSASYARRFGDQRTTLSGMGSMYDATYALAFALAQRRQLPSSGKALAAGLRALAQGQSTVELRAERVAALFDRVLSGESPGVIGSVAPLRWDERGAATGGALEVWCLGRVDQRLDFVGSGVRMDVAAAMVSGTATGCDGQGSVPTGQPTTGIQSGEPMREPPPPDPQPPAAGAPAEVPTTQPDAGPAPSPDAGGPADAGEPQSTDIPCGLRSCDSQLDEYCCVSTLRGVTEDPLPEDFSCQKSAQQCAISLHCTSDSDCSGGEVCCGTGTQTECTAEESCLAQAGTRLACESARDCAGGLLCCAHLTPGTTTYSHVACEATCELADSAVTLCRSDADCAPLSALATCRPSRIVPNLQVCYTF